MTNSFDLEDRIDFEKYLNCKSCQEAGVYCSKHRKEVEQILKQNN
ncbi:MAG TPA: hypothetical protein VFG25_04980 [Nitrosopumilaceae archaeon]|nr:hypothetical protein [Nitrosopumilaceae archaeon]